MKKIYTIIILFLKSFTLFSQIPTDSLVLWLRADTGVITKGNTVEQWLDISGRNHHASKSSSLYAPLLIKNELNNLPVIRFNGLNQTLETNPFQTFTNKRGTIIVVAKYFSPSKSNSSGANTFISTYFGNQITWQTCAVNNLFIYYDGVGSTGAPISEITENDWEVLTLLRFNDSSCQFFRKGEPRVNFTINNNQPTINKLKIGSNGKLEVLNGDIAEIIIYNKALSNNEIKVVNDYLLNKYQIKKPIIVLTSNKWYYVTIGLTTILIILLIIKYITNKKYKRKIEKLKTENELNIERQRISREMHDDIGAGLTQISLISESIKNKINANEEAIAIANTSRQLVKSMNEIIWSISNEYNTLQDLLIYLREQINSLLEFSNINYTIIFPENNIHFKLTSHQKRNIILIVRESINNVLKYSQATELKIQIKVEENTLNITIKDNGIGFDPAAIKKGNGIKNIKFRIKEINGSCKIDSIVGDGTQFIYYIPLTNSTT